MSPPDFRSDPSSSPEGHGRAVRAWDAYTKAMRPAIEPVARSVARKWTADLVGFYVLWHAYGGFEGLEQRYGMHKATIWRKVAKFRLAFGEHPDVYVMPGVAIDPAAYWEAALSNEKHGSS